MSRNKRSDKDIWSKKFTKEQDELEYVSRSERNREEKNREGMSPMLTGTVVFLAALILAIIFYYIWYINRPANQPNISGDSEIRSVLDDKNEEKEQEEQKKKEQEEQKKKEQEEQKKKEQEVQKKKEQEEQKKKEQEEQKKKEQEEQKIKEQEEQKIKEQEEQKKKEQKKKEQEEQKKKEQEEQKKKEQEESEQNSRKTYTVVAGDNMYRIALNHGMTTTELMQLNNLTDETVYVGQVLKVK